MTERYFLRDPQPPAAEFNMPARTRWGVVVLLTFCGTIAGSQVGKAAIAIPALMQDLSLSLVFASWIVGALATLGAMIGLPLSVVLSLYPPRATLIAGLLILAAGSIAGTFAPDGTVLFATRVLEGCGFTATVLSAPRLFRQIVNERDSQVAFSIWASYMPVGTAGIMLLGPLLMAASGWRGLWLFCGILPLVFALIVAGLKIPSADPHPAQQSLLGNLRAGFATPGPILIGVTFGVYTLQYFALAGLFPTLLVDRLGLSIASAGVISAFAVLANGAGNLAAGALLRAGLPLWSLLAAGFLASGTLSYGIFSGSLPVLPVALLAALSLAVTGVIPGSIFAAAPAVSATPAVLAMTLGLIMQFALTGQFVGPASLASLVDRFGWPYAPALFTAVAAVGVGFALVVRAVMSKAKAS